MSKRVIVVEGRPFIDANYFLGFLEGSRSSFIRRGKSVVAIDLMIKEVTESIDEDWIERPTSNHLM
jgi:hypothetical protein